MSIWCDADSERSRSWRRKACQRTGGSLCLLGLLLLSLAQDVYGQAPRTPPSRFEASLDTTVRKKGMSDGSQGALIGAGIGATGGALFAGLSNRGTEVGPTLGAVLGGATFGLLGALVGFVAGKSVEAAGRSHRLSVTWLGGASPTDPHGNLTISVSFPLATGRPQTSARQGR